jgi:DNA (cytosine-5)-methyltransferase 1
MTVRECARIQSFPDWYQFRKKYTTGGQMRKLEVPRYTQVGNAIPPLFAELAGVVLLKML